MTDTNDRILWLEDREGAYVCALSELFGPECTVGITLDNELAVVRSHRTIARAKLDPDDRIVRIDVDELPPCMSRDGYFKAIEPFVGMRVLYRQS